MADNDPNQGWQFEPTEDPTSGFSHEQTPEPGDEILKQNLADYSPESVVHGWEKLSASLDAADEAFDRTVQNRLRQYHPPFDPHAWTQFARKFSSRRHLRNRLILLKVSEALAVILLLFTALQLKDLNSFPGKHDMSSPNMADSSAAPRSLSEGETDGVAIAELQHSTETAKKHPVGTTQKNNRNKTAEAVYEFSAKNTVDPASSLTDPSVPAVASAHHVAANDENFELILSEEPPVVSATNADDGGSDAFDFLASPVIELNGPTRDNLIASADPVIRAPRKGKYFEFGMLVQGDYNQLKMPGDKINTNAKQFIFPLQGLSSPGYGAGLTFAISHPRWAIETGAIYNAKKFSPDREVVVEDALASSNVELEKMLMQFVSIPLQFRYKFDPHGKLRAYAQTGLGMHMIMQSHADVDVDYDFPTLAAGEDPNADPTLLRTIRQTQRASEDLRDQAPFSTNSLISANLGLGIEYDLFDHNTIFIQSIYQYQIPNLRFQTHQDKHLVTLSLQAGVRAPISR